MGTRSTFDSFSTVIVTSFRNYVLFRTSGCQHSMMFSFSKPVITSLLGRNAMPGDVYVTALERKLKKTFLKKVKQDLAV